MNVKYKPAAILVLAILIFSLALPLAAPVEAATPESGGRSPRFIDEVGVLSSAQAANLTAKLDEISEYHRFDTVVAVVEYIDLRSPRVYAADFYEERGFSADGIILLIATERRDFAFVTTGFGLYAFTDAGQEYLEKLFLPHLQRDDYYEAFMTFADSVDDFMTRADDGRPYDRGNIPLTSSEKTRYRLYTIGGSLVLALIVAFLVTGTWKYQLKSVRPQNLASAYIREGSMVLTGKSDIFLYRNVTRVARASESSSSGSRGSFKSSSGSSFSGRSGKF